MKIKIIGILGTILLGTVLGFTPFQTPAACENGQSGCEPFKEWCRKSNECGKIRNREERDRCIADNPYPKGKKPDNCPACVRPE